MSATGRAYLDITEAVETLARYVKLGLIDNKTISELCTEFEIDGRNERKEMLP